MGYCRKQYKKELEDKKAVIVSKILEVETLRSKEDVSKDEFWKLHEKLQLLYIDKSTVDSRLQNIGTRFSGIPPMAIDENIFINKNK